MNEPEHALVWDVGTYVRSMHLLTRRTTYVPIQFTKLEQTQRISINKFHAIAICVRTLCTYTPRTTERINGGTNERTNDRMNNNIITYLNISLKLNDILKILEPFHLALAAFCIQSHTHAGTYNMRRQQRMRHRHTHIVVSVHSKPSLFNRQATESTLHSKSRHSNSREV